MGAERTARSRLERFVRALGLLFLFYLLFTVAYAGMALAAPRVPGLERVGVQAILIPWLALVSVVVASYIMLRLVEKLPWSAVGLDRPAASPRLLLKGGVLGGLTIGLASVALLAIHQLRIEHSVPGSWWGAAERSTAILLPAAFFEELLFRGYAFSVLRRTAGWKTALVITSIAFGFVHAWNPGADAESILAVMVAGFFLGVILLATRSLYAAGAAHFAWNWVMAVALHIEVSGVSSPNPDYRTIETGPTWLTGGAWGPEGGLAAVAAMFVAIFYLYGRYLRRTESKA
ncbi:MAG: type II CAAX endopeptidase family protein [Gemmatimonadaceae bacterium]